MQSVDFPGRNKIIGEGQPQYTPIYAYLNPHDIEGGVQYCMELSDEEIAEVLRTRRIWLNQLTFRQNFQPISGTTLCIMPKHKDAFLVCLYLPVIKLADTPNSLAIWNSLDRAAPDKIERYGQTYLRTETRPVFTRMFPVHEAGSLFFSEFPDNEPQNIAMYGSPVLVEMVSNGTEIQAIIHKLPLKV